MIELNSKTQEDFLNREWVQRLLDAGVDMSDAKYCLVKAKYERDPDTNYPLDQHYYIGYNIPKGIWKGDCFNDSLFNEVCPTYTASELLHKLPDMVFRTIDGEQYAGPLVLRKVLFSHIAYYALRNDKEKENVEYLSTSSDSLVEALASLLIHYYTQIKIA